ncbi:MAG: CPBP family intramembrane metalloprotease [Anaerolineae bacterium]|nr:CPBP family intramembrane metalloprotease [Anaerolineae bacterium]
MNLSTTIKQNPVASFIVLTLGLSFAAMLLPVPPESAFTVIAFIAVIFPTVVAFALAALIDDRRGCSRFAAADLPLAEPIEMVSDRPRIGFVIHFGASILALVTGRISTIEIAAPTAFFIAFFPLALLEEIGWRGFALRRMLDRYSPFTATVIVGIPWALLHVVLFVLFVPDASPIAEGLVVLPSRFP